MVLPVAAESDLGDIEIAATSWSDAEVRQRLFKVRSGEWRARKTALHLGRFFRSGQDWLRVSDCADVGSSNSGLGG